MHNLFSVTRTHSFAHLARVLDQVLYDAFKRLSVANLFIRSLLPVL